MPESSAADRRAKLEGMALRLAFDVDALVQMGPDAPPRDVAELRVAADELRRAMLVLALELGDEDPSVRLARNMLEGLRSESSRIAPLADTGSSATAGDGFAAAMRWWHEAVHGAAPPAAERTCEPGTAWAISGSYLEACNCDPLCGCSPARDRQQRRPAHGPCTGALSWQIDDGHAGQIELGGLAIAVAFRHDRGTPSWPWNLALYLDQRAADRQRVALEAMFTGSRNHAALVPFPWASSRGHRVRVRTVPIEVDHAARLPWFAAAGHACARAGEPVCAQQADASLISDHHAAGIERHGGRVCVADEPLAFESLATALFRARSITRPNTAHNAPATLRSHRTPVTGVSESDRGHYGAG